MGGSHVMPGLSRGIEGTFAGESCVQGNRIIEKSHLHDKTLSLIIHPSYHIPAHLLPPQVCVWGNGVG